MLYVGVAAPSDPPRGVRESLFILKHAEKFVSIVADIIGDICNILSGSAGAAIVVKIMRHSGGGGAFIVAAVVSSLIAGFTILGKAFGKKYALNNAPLIIFRVGKLLSIFRKKKRA